MRYIYFALSIVLLVIFGGGVTLAQVESQPAAQSRLYAPSAGCDMVNHSIYDGYYGMVSSDPYQFFTGETIAIFANEPTSGPVSTISLSINGVVVDVETFPEVLQYTFSADSVATYEWRGDPGWTITWNVSCTSPTPPPSDTPEPSVTPEPSITPEPSATPEPSITPEPSVTPLSSVTPPPVPGVLPNSSSAGSKPACTDLIDFPVGAVVGKFVRTTPAYYAPSLSSVTGIELEVGKTLWVLGIDSTGQFYKVVLSCSLLWVPIDSMGPNTDNFWQGAPLPTNIIQ